MHQLPVMKIFLGLHPPKTKMEAENHPFEKETHIYIYIQHHRFLGSILVFGVVDSIVNLPTLA